MDPIINAFHIDYKIIIAQVLNFGIVFLVLYFYAIKPLSKLMRERGEKIQKGVNDAKTNAEILNNTKAEYEAMISRAKTEANKIFQDGKKEAEDKRVEMLDKTKAEVIVLIENGKKNLESEKAKMIADVKDEVTALAVKIAEKLIASKVDGRFDEKTVEEIKSITN